MGTRGTPAATSGGFFLGLVFDPEDGRDLLIPKRQALSKRHIVTTQKTVLLILIEAFRIHCDIWAVSRKRIDKHVATEGLIPGNQLQSLRITVSVDTDTESCKHSEMRPFLANEYMISEATRS
jgi:hypothetical protein